MGVYIKNIEIPTEEYGPMTIKVYPNGHVAEYIGDIGRVWDAVPVPPHFDLIDHNALKIAVMDCDAETRIDFLKHAMDCINKAPVVIPSDMPLFEAEEGET